MIGGTMICKKGIGVCAHKWDVRCGHALRSRVPVIHDMALVSAIHLIGMWEGLD